MTTASSNTRLRYATSMPIADYDDLRVSDILPLLSELDGAELAVVRRHELAGKARTSVLRRIDALHTKENPVPGPSHSPVPAPRLSPETPPAHDPQQWRSLLDPESFPPRWSDEPHHKGVSRLASLLPGRRGRH